MTEAEWLVSSDIRAMLVKPGTQLTLRRLRLLACGFLRRLWAHLVPEGHAAVETAERYADGMASQEELHAQGLAVAVLPVDLVHELAQAVTVTEWTHTEIFTTISALTTLDEEAQRLSRLHRGPACDLLRDLVVNPFGTDPVLDPAWLSWHNGTIRFLTEDIYQQRTFEQMPILGDALEDAGCTDGLILDHCRSGGEHIRGCWVLDLLLRKEPVTTEQRVSEVLQASWPREYRTIIDTVEAMSGRYNRSGRGLFARITLRVEPRTAGPAIVFQHAPALSRVLPREMIGAVVEGIRTALQELGKERELAGLTIRLLDGRYHDVDSTREGFAREAIHVFRQALSARTLVEVSRTGGGP
jgi:hypothetical protein